MRIDSSTGRDPLGTVADTGGGPDSAARGSANGTQTTGGDALAAFGQNSATLAALNPRRPLPKQSAKPRQNRPGRQEAPARGSRPKEGTIRSAEESFKQQIGERAQNREQFHKLMKVVYGQRYNEATVENLRQQALSGDFSFLPKARFVDNATLHGNYAAYDAKSGTIFLNEGLKNNPQLLADYYAEEAGHHMDTFFGKGDAVGDEGELMRNLLNGTTMTAAQFQAIRSENDQGAITVDGQTIDVEFGFFKKIKKGFKKIKKSVSNFIADPLDAPKKLWKGVKKVAKKAWNGIKDAGKWLMTSTVGNYLMSAALAAFTVVTGGVGSAAMIAWEAAKQAALAVGKSFLVQQAGKVVGKITGSKTLGRIAGAVGAAVGGGKVDFSSTAKFANTAGQVAKDIAVSEAKRAVNKHVVSRIDSPYLQQLASFAVDKGIDAAGNYAYGKITAQIEGNKKVEVNVDGRDDNPATQTDGKSSASVTDLFDLQKQAQRGVDMAKNVSVDWIIDKVAPEELGNVLQSLIGREAGDFTVGNLVDAVRQGFNNFEGMTASEVADALQGYVTTAIERVGEIDGDDIARYAGIAFDQAGEVRLNDLLGATGYDQGSARSIVEYLAREAGTTPEALQIEQVLELLRGNQPEPAAGDARPEPAAAAG